MSARSNSHIIAAARQVDGIGTLAPVLARWTELREQGARLVELVIDPLEAGWDTLVEANHFRSGCAPLEALAHADTLIQANQADAVLIRGTDCLRSRYAGDKLLRQQQMNIYGDDCSIPQAYTLLAHAFMRRHHLSSAHFKQLAAALFENYTRTAKRRADFHPPKPQAYEMVTDLFRFVDCANPVVDFDGALIVASPSLATTPSVEILAVETAQLANDGPNYIEQIAPYAHLRTVCESACTRAGVNLPCEFKSGNALLEAYTCFPVAPLGFLLAAGIAGTIEEIEPLLASREITVTGGMNLARAPWNNPALNALIVMYQQLLAGEPSLGAVHGNGGLGYKQGLALLSRCF